MVLHKKAQERGDGSPDGDEDHGDCREEAHIRHAPDGRPACQAVWTARKPEEGGQNIPKTGLEHAWKTQIGDNPLKQEGSQTDCAKPVLGGRHVLHMVRKGGWCYSFNVIDVFTRQWLGFAFDTRAARHAAIMSVNNAVASRKPDPGRLTIRVDNGSQYTSRDFRRSVDVLGARLEYIYVNTPQQNGHIESFHKALKKEYV